MSYYHLSSEERYVISYLVLGALSLREIGRWPWPRSKIAQLVDILSADGAAVIGFDIGFLEPDENSQLEIIGQFNQKVDELTAVRFY